MTDFFKHGNKVYSENLNDGILVGNSFDWTVNMSLPGDTGGVFPNTTTVVKAKVADVYATPNSNLSIGETITNNAGSSQVYRLTVYPNFNRFGGFTFVSLEGDGDVIITEVGASAPIRNNLDYSNLGDVVELKQLKEYDIVVTIPAGGVVTGLGFGFKSSSADVTASINQSNVTGLESALTGLNEGLDDVETGVSNNLSKINTLSREVWNNTSQTGTSRIDSLVDSVNSLDTSIANHLEDLTWINIYNNDGVELWTNKALKLSYLHFYRNISAGANATLTIKEAYSPTDEKIPYCPPTNSYCPTIRKDVYLNVNYLGKITLLNYGSAFTNQNIQGMMVFKAKGVE